jgi:anaerobic magnesium-protoporphyrin IX monomethyl ester cyclase
MKKKNKISLLFPPGKVWVRPDGTPSSRKHISPPIGLAYLASSLEKADNKVQVIDTLVEGFDNETYEEPFIIYGLSPEETANRVKKFNPDVIGISALFSMTISEVYKLCKELKKKLPNVPIIMGGQHATGAPFEVLKNPNVDYVIAGEAEITLCNFMRALNKEFDFNEIKNLYYKNFKGEVVHTNTLSNVKPMVVGKGWNYYNRKDSGVPEKLDDLPYPAWHLFNMEAYWNSNVRTGGGNAKSERYAVMLSTRGCPHTCTFCTSPLASGYKAYRKRSNECVVREIKFLKEKYDIGEVQFVEDNFFVSKKRAKDLMRELAKEFPDMYFQSTGGTEVNALDDEMIELMAKSNFYHAILAIESGDPEVQKNSVDKEVNLDRLPQIIQKLNEHKIDTKALFMIGFPGETKSQIQKTVDLALNCGILDFNLSIVTALPGTPLYDECLEKGLFVEGYTLEGSNYSKSNIKLKDVSPEELENIRVDVWKQAMKKRLDNQKKNILEPGSDLKKNKHTFTSIEEFQFHGFSTRPPKRIEKDTNKKQLAAVSL